jgi:MFS transporter, FHS family, glucose/mannose:H+ symporter
VSKGCHCSLFRRCLLVPVPAECKPLVNTTDNHAQVGAPNPAANAVVHAGFAVTGVITTMLGPLLPVLINRWSLSDARAGLFFSAQYFAALTGALTLSALLVWRGYKIVLVTGFALMAVGVSGLLLGNHTMGLIATGTYGYGLGLILSSTNLWVAEIAGSRRAAAISIVNVAWGLGAIACPALVAYAQKASAVPAMLAGVGALAGATAVTLAAMNVEPVSETIADGTPPPAFLPIRKIIAIPLGVFFFLYVGCEGSVGGWTAALAKRMGTSPGNMWALAPMFFWGGLLVGRVFVPVILRRFKEQNLLAAGLIVGAIGNFALVEVRTFQTAAVCGVVIGLGFSSVYPILVSSLVRIFGERAKRVASIMFPLASLGGASMPWLVGVVSTHAGGLRAGLMIPLAGVVMMVALMPVLRRQAFV